jgi:RNA polymerase sigma factor (sigma-70 family)
MDATPPTVCVVDDDAAVRTALARLLRSVGLRVDTFASASEFLGYQPPDGPACLVLDVRLSGENGLALQEALQTGERRLPIIFLTGHGTVPMCARALKAGAVDFLQKPCHDQELLDAIATALDQDRHALADQHHRARLHQHVTTLTPREHDVLALVVTGKLNKQIADTLGTSEKTIKVHRARVMQKMQATSLAELVRMADALDLRAPQVS